MREANGEDQPLVAAPLPGLISVLVVSREVSRSLSPSFSHSRF